MALGNALDINFGVNQLLYAPSATTLAGLVTANSGVLITSAGGVPSISSTLPNAVQDNITRLGTIVSIGAPLGGTFGGTGVNNGAFTLTLAGNLQTAGAFNSVFTMTAATNVTFPTSGTLATTAGTVSSVSGTANRITSTGGTTPVIDISAAYVGQTSITTLGTITTGVWNGTPVPGTAGGTGINNGASTITLGGSILTAGALTLAGAFGATFTFTGVTGVTFPTSGTLATTAAIPSFPLSLANGGLNAALVANVGGIFYSTATAGAILAGTATARQMLQSGASAAPAWSTTVWPATSTINRILYSSAANTVSEITTGNDGLLVTSNTGVPSILAGPGTTGQILQSNAAAAPSFSTASYPSTTTINRILYSTANDTVGQLATANQGVLTTGATGIPVITALATNGQIIIGSTAGVPAAATITAGAGITVTNAANSITIASTGGLSAAVNSFCQGRLTLTTGTAVTTGDVTAATTVYFTPFRGNYISLYTAATWTLYTFTQLSIAVPASTTTLYDVFVYDNAGTVTLQTVAWTNSTTRATAITYQDGVLCKSGDLGKRYLGTFSTTGVNGQTEDSISNRFLYNYYNRVLRQLTRQESTATWAYSTAAFHQVNASASNQVNIIIGVSEDIFNARALSLANSTGQGIVSPGIGINSTTVNSAQIQGQYMGSNAALSSILATHAFYQGYLAVGLTNVAWLEYGNATGVTWYGTGGTVGVDQSGLIGSMLM